MAGNGKDTRESVEDDQASSGEVGSLLIKEMFGEEFYTWTLEKRNDLQEDVHKLVRHFLFDSKLDEDGGKQAVVMMLCIHALIMNVGSLIATLESLDISGVRQRTLQLLTDTIDYHHKNNVDKE